MEEEEKEIIDFSSIINEDFTRNLNSPCFNYEELMKELTKNVVLKRKNSQKEEPKKIKTEIKELQIQNLKTQTKENNKENLLSETEYISNTPYRKKSINQNPNSGRNYNQRLKDMLNVKNIETIILEKKQKFTEENLISQNKTKKFLEKHNIHTIDPISDAMNTN